MPGKVQRCGRADVKVVLHDPLCGQHGHDPITLGSRSAADGVTSQVSSSGMSCRRTAFMLGSRSSGTGRPSRTSPIRIERLVVHRHDPLDKDFSHGKRSRGRIFSPRISCRYETRLTNAAVSSVYTPHMSKVPAKHVVPHKDGWVIKSEDRPASKRAKVYATKRDAMVSARSMAKKSGATLVIYGRDGRIQDVDTYERMPTRRELLPH